MNWVKWKLIIYAFEKLILQKNCASVERKASELALVVKENGY